MQLMKVVGVTDVSEFDNLVKQHAPQIENFDKTFKNLNILPDDDSLKHVKSFKKSASLKISG